MTDEARAGEPRYTQVRFSGGPFYWRKRQRLVMDIADHVDEVHVPGLTRRMKREYRSVKEFEADMAKGPVRWRTGVYQRVAPDRFRWMGWKAP